MSNTKLQRLFQHRKRKEYQLSVEVQCMSSELNNLRLQLDDTVALKTTYLDEAGDNMLTQPWIRRDRIQFAVTISSLIHQLQQQFDAYKQRLDLKRKEWLQATKESQALESVLDKRLVTESLQAKRRDRRHQADMWRASL